MSGFGLSVEWYVGLFCGFVTLLAIAIGCYRSLYQRTVMERAVLDKRSCFSSSNQPAPNIEPDKRPSDPELIINVHPQPPDIMHLVKRTPTPTREYYSNSSPKSVGSVKRDSADSARQSISRKRKLNEDNPMKIVNILQPNDPNDPMQCSTLVPQRIPSFLLQDHSRNMRRVRRRLSDSAGKKDDRGPVVLEIQMLQRDPTDSTGPTRRKSTSRPRSVGNSLSSRGSLLKTVLQQQSTRRGSPKAQYSHYSSHESAASGYPLNKDQMIGPNLFPLENLEDRASGYPEIKKEIILRPHYSDGKKYTVRERDPTLPILQKISDPNSTEKLLIKIKDEDDMKLQEVSKDRSSSFKDGSMNRKKRKSVKKFPLVNMEQNRYKPYNSLSESGTSRYPSYASQQDFRSDNLRIVDRSSRKRTRSIISSATSVTSTKSKLATMSEFSQYFDDSRASFADFRSGYNSSLETPQTIISILQFCVGTPHEIADIVPSEKGYLKTLKKTKMTDTSSEYLPSEQSPEVSMPEIHRSFQKVEKVLSEQSSPRPPNAFSESPEREPPPPPNWTEPIHTDGKADNIRHDTLCDDSNGDRSEIKFTRKFSSFASSSSGSAYMSPPTPPYQKLRELHLKSIHLLAESSDDAVEFPSTPSVNYVENHHLRNIHLPSTLSSVSEEFDDSFDSDNYSIKQKVKRKESLDMTKSESAYEAPPPFLSGTVALLDVLSEDVESPVDLKQFIKFRSRESEIPEDVLDKHRTGFDYLGRTRSTSEPRKDPVRALFEDTDAEAEDDISLSRSLQRSDTNSSRTKIHIPLRALYEDLDIERKDTSISRSLHRSQSNKTSVNTLEAAEFRKEFGEQLSTIKSRLHLARQLSSQRNDRWKWIKKRTETFVSIFGSPDSPDRASPKEKIAKKIEDSNSDFSSKKGHVFTLNNHIEELEDQIEEMQRVHLEEMRVLKAQFGSLNFGYGVGGIEAIDD